MSIRILIVDDHEVVRFGLRAVFGSDPKLSIVGEAPGARHALALARSLTPDVITLDVSMRGESGIDAISKFRTAAASSRILMLSMHDDPELVDHCMNAGADGFAIKSETAAALTSAVFDVMQGTRRRPPTQGDDPLMMLTAREKQIFRMLLRGRSSSEIAVDLVISVKTVETHRANINRKLDVHSAGELFLFAQRHRLSPV